MNLTNISINERNQTQSDSIVSLHLYDILEKAKYREQIRSIAVRGWSGRKARIAKGCKGTVGGDRNVLYLVCGSSYLTVYICQNSMKYTL